MNDKSKSTTIKRDVELKPVKKFKEVIKVKSLAELNEAFRQRHLK